FIDGQLVATHLGPVSVEYNAGGGHALFIGSYDGAQNGFDGAVDDVALYNRVITPTEVHQLFVAGGFSKAGGSTVVGNLIGTDRTGAHALANAGRGVQLGTESINNTIGGAAAGAARVAAAGAGAAPGLAAAYPGNVISGNRQDGVLIDPSMLV